ncbi:MAG: Fe-S cluster assembly protein SufD [Marinifilaceae bacterium]|jgi:Fe-S cluster assembly protein SufD|nr:Fe-S cluster assembly protein SufD [Marinifilaceae bacterium]
MSELKTINQDFVDLYTNAKDRLFEASTKEMNDAREKAFECFKSNGIPSKSNEDYKYTDLIPAFAHQYGINLSYTDVDVDLNEIFSCDVPELDTNMVLLTNGWYYKNNYELKLPKGVIVCGLLEAAQKYPDIFKKHYAKYANVEKDGTVALNTSLAQDGYFVYIPKSVVVEKPIQIVNLMRFNSDLMCMQRNLVVVEENAQVQLIVCDHTLNPRKYMNNTVTEVAVDKNSIFDLYTIQNQHLNSSIINSVFVKQEASSNVLTNTMSLHGGIIRNNHTVIMDDEHCENNTFGMYLLDRNQHVDNFTTINHDKPNCISNEHFKGIMDDNATAAFTGKIHVKRDAQKTEAYQSNNNLLLSNNAVINTKPQLIIDADDVKCSHGATVGQIDEDALFYLQARGIDKKEAMQLLMFAFAHEIIEKIRVEPLKERIAELVDKRLRGESSKCSKCALGCNS